MAVFIALLTHPGSHDSTKPGVSISAIRQAPECGARYVFPGIPKDLPPPPSPPDFNESWRKWGQTNAAADGSSTVVLLNVASADERQVTLTKLNVFVTERERPRGVVVGFPCGGPANGRYIQYDLDADPPRVVASSREKVDVGQTRLRVEPLTFPYTVTNSDTATLLLVATAESCACRWHADLSWQAGAASGTAHIRDDDGRLFHTSGATGLPRYTPSGQSNAPWRQVGG